MERKEVEQVNALNIAGLDFISEMKRYYPKSGTGSHILGFTNIDNLGLDGIEKTFDPNLRGQPGLFLLNTDARQKMIYKNQQDPVPGNSIVLTIDEQLQYITERELDKAMGQWKAQAAVAIMMDPYTGGILALANKPDYNPNFPGKYTSHQRRNRAVTDMYEPGSTFKSFLASAALEEKVVKVEQRFDCSRGYIQLGGRKIKDVHRNGVLTFNKVLQKSSNVGMVQVGYLLGKKRYYEYMSGFGFGRKTDSGLPGEISGYLANVKNWSGLSLGSMSIGQEIGVTPLQVARGYCAIANGGLMVKPYIVSKILDSSGKTIKHYPPTIEKRIISKETSDTMKSILETVTQEGGTAINAAIKGNPVAGKTGTAQMIDPVTKTYSNKDYVSSFVGFVPADKPRFVLIVVVYQPRGAIYGGAVAAPVFRAIAEEALTYLDVPVDVDDTQYTKVVTR
jgi:cell division protein FtsI (penicillin-binding protein 3)